MPTALLQLSAAQEHAQAGDQTDALTLTPRDWEAFVAVLDHQDQPRPWLAGAMERYRVWRSKKEKHKSLF